ncbi:hypothetical protein CW751_08340 [Brumimicrobium salinarum]|uniref:Endonuclease/exonuclease/phosphatase domain-containing protein n=1 Tax=Brumimicrobium salinarum TaxID=2058658 RepID=A0A2I0R2Z8_9FLAO|nr:endonuclease/exonuclease/phosphatase family protein [Brumimicrobium salinarum]PKR80770.1 hypothetical protein CW751_08340 [Brumimicrobium salinarum]
MELFFLIFSILLILLSILPFSQHQHWVFRVPEFIKLQILVLQIIASIGLVAFMKDNILYYAVLLIQIALIVYHLYLFFHFTQLHKKPTPENENAQKLKIISTNVYQYNTDYERFLNLIKDECPTLFLTIESNSDWEKAMQELEADYPYTQKVTLENTYGMHLYSKIPFESVKTHYFVAEDVPSIEAHFKTENGNNFCLFCVHPPPPSPTQEANSKERDGDLMCIANKINQMNKPVLVVGDFNTVAWSKVSLIFKKASQLIDGRHGRGILASFHAKYWFFRAPLDLVFHSKHIFLGKLDILKSIGSDHFPVACEFSLNKVIDTKENNLSNQEIQQKEKMIREGKAEESDKR